MMANNNVAKGFTLVELMIVVAIVAILATFAVPAYNDYVRQGYRADGKATLLEIQLAQERHRANNTEYAECLGSSCADNASLGWSNDKITGDYYDFAITASGQFNFTATATGKGTQLQDEEGGVDCSTLRIVVNANGDNQTPNECW